MVSTRFCWTSRETIGSFLAVMVALLVVLLAPRPAQARDWVVDRRDDPNLTTTPTADNCRSDALNDCSLRGAISKSNIIITTDTIKFEVSGTGVQIISPTSPLPAITDNATIDGYTQPGAQANSASTNANNAVIKVQLSGESAPQSASGLIVSGTEARNTTIKGLAINSFGAEGVLVEAPDTTVRGNFVGTNAAGDAAPGNGANGINLRSSGNVIGGPENAAQNVISGNASNGVLVGRANNVVSNNHIGTDADAEEDLGNSRSGVLVDNVPDVVIGGSSADGSTLNIISGNDRHGVEVSNIGADGTRILGNFIGLNREGDGFSHIGNSLDGVRVSSTPGVGIGGILTGEGNTISDNGQHGVEIVGTSSTNVRVLGNRIGTNKNGASRFGNAGDGVRIGNSSNTTIGGTNSGAGNVISDNGANGVFITGTSSATSNKVQGNFIGTNANGTSRLGNGSDGVSIFNAPGSLVGGTASGAHNIISGNTIHGVRINGSSGANKRIEGNFIGTDVTGTVDLGNGSNGVDIRNSAHDTTVGGAVAGARNIISGNKNGVGISESEVTGNVVAGNFIGTDASGTAALGNAEAGVIVSDASGNMIGDTVPAAANTISLNQSRGVVIVGDTATRNSILRNSIFGNGIPPGLGIDLGNNGVTTNDARDPDTGPNGLQNFPVLTSANTATIAGRLNSRPSKTFTIQFFSSPPPVVLSGLPEGETFLGEKTVTTASDGKVSFTFAIPFGTSVTTGEVVTATATNAAGSTSEFSAPRFVE